MSSSRQALAARRRGHGLQAEAWDRPSAECCRRMVPAKRVTFLVGTNADSCLPHPAEVEWRRGPTPFDRGCARLPPEGRGPARGARSSTCPAPPTMPTIVPRVCPGRILHRRNRRRPERERPARSQSTSTRSRSTAPRPAAPPAGLAVRAPASPAATRPPPGARACRRMSSSDQARSAPGLDSRFE
jgi:hypothetical protein